MRWSAPTIESRRDEWPGQQQAARKWSRAPDASAVLAPRNNYRQTIKHPQQAAVTKPTPAIRSVSVSDRPDRNRRHARLIPSNRPFSRVSPGASTTSHPTFSAENARSQRVRHFDDLVGTMSGAATEGLTTAARATQI
jgi:hypothetical protein